MRTQRGLTVTRPPRTWSVSIDTFLPSGSSPGPDATAVPVAGSARDGQRPGRDLGLTDDRSVVQAVLSGNRDAFRILVEREGAAVIRACHRVLGDRHEAEDVAQEAFVTAYRLLGTWRGDGPFGAWLTRIAVRDAVRRASRRREVSWISPEPARRGDGGGERSVISAQQLAAPVTGQPDPWSSTDPVAITLRTERSGAIRNAVARLEEPYREVVALRFFADRSLAEIATETGRPLATVKTHLRRGLLRLRERLDEGDHR